MNPSPLEKQPVLLTTGPSLHSLHHYVYGSPAFSSDLSKHFLLFEIDMIIVPVFLHFKILFYIARSICDVSTVMSQVNIEME